MYDPYGDRQARRAARQAYRDQRRYYRYQNPMRGLAGAFVLIALIIAFAFHGPLGSFLFLPLLFVGLAFASLFGSISTYNRTGIYGGFYGFVWCLGLALCFIIGFWPWILLPVVASMILGAFIRPIMGGLAGASFLASQQPQQPYQQQPYQQQEPYQQGYQGAPAQPHQTYQEGGQQYEMPQTPHPEQQRQQELPPMEQ